MLNSLTMNNLKIRGTKKTLLNCLDSNISYFFIRSMLTQPQTHYTQLPFQHTLG